MPTGGISNPSLASTTDMSALNKNQGSENKFAAFPGVLQEKRQEEVKFGLKDQTISAGLQRSAPSSETRPHPWQENFIELNLGLQT